jgi:hypothetical protein
MPGGCGDASGSMAALSDIPTEALARYLESLACKLVEAGVPAERAVDAMKLAAVRVQILHLASTPEPTSLPLHPPPDASLSRPAHAPYPEAPTLAAVLEKLQAETQRDSPEDEERPERRKAGRPWSKPTTEAEPSEAPEKTQPDAARHETSSRSSGRSGRQGR